LEPTTGFNIKTLPFKDTVISIKEVGGSYKIQPFWDHYFGGKNGILFVVDASGSDQELIAARDVLKSVFSDMRLKGKPCLVIGTHADLVEAKSSEDLEKCFGSIMHGRKWSVKCCSAFDPLQIKTALETLIELMLVTL
jgi:ADP-ribosylation factor-like protein 15